MIWNEDVAWYFSGTIQ